MAIQSSPLVQQTKRTAHTVNGPVQKTDATSASRVIEFAQKEIDMMPGDWQETGNPSPYELRMTIATCKRLWQLNQDALKHPDCDHHVTAENIKRLESLYMNLMDYLVE
ncbi:hypothetical protein THMIRHAM_21680 [Thiomicrorhabdus immobilis]|uniref:dATP/dGTP diphosphohydrolase N-terminal domain-containing protein n=1 Tax=Thiomicrorhabdus immobilis TaxID=2791037 RepID=A0ABM7MFS2_9GAMM|nr:hypothetical protein [Thiomicrorhabdus immobilis]BCN94383.1 hypothetical protein THMIRHAM_21680 [Thiomicrorhabdus immobilis]